MVISNCFQDTDPTLLASGKRTKPGGSSSTDNASSSASSSNTMSSSSSDGRTAETAIETTTTAAAATTTSRPRPRGSGGPCCGCQRCWWRHRGCRRTGRSCITRKNELWIKKDCVRLRVAIDPRKLLNSESRMEKTNAKMLAHWFCFKRSIKGYKLAFIYDVS